jgi:hypothetical protein
MQFNRLKRRDLITLLGGAAAAGTSPLAALARAFDKRPRRIAYLSGGSRAGTDKVVTALLEGLRAHGYVEGPDFEIDYYWAEGHLERILTLAQEAVRSKPDLILASIVQAAVVASDMTKTIPIVCPFLADPVRLGLIKNDARPGGNVTGLLLFVEGLPSKQLELVLDLIPGADKIGLVVNPDNANSLSQRQELEDRGRSKGHQDRNYRGAYARKCRFDLPRASERTGRCRHRASGHGVLQPPRSIGGVRNGSEVADRVRLPGARRRRRPDQLRDQHIGEFWPRSRLRD